MSPVFGNRTVCEHCGLVGETGGRKTVGDIDRCSSYERVANEKQYSLVRRFFPKGKSFDNITDKQVAFVENRINNLPRKIFNYHSADFIFNNVLFYIAI